MTEVQTAQPTTPTHTQTSDEKEYDFETLAVTFEVDSMGNTGIPVGGGNKERRQQRSTCLASTPVHTRHGGRSVRLPSTSPNTGFFKEKKKGK